MPEETTQTMEKAGNGGVLALVFGLVSMVSVFSGFGALFGLAAGILGVVFGIRTRRRSPSASERDLATAGLVCSLVALAVLVLVLLMILGIVGTIISILQEMPRQV